ETGKEAATSVASRIVSDNLPKFCDNLIQFENREAEYFSLHSKLQSLGRTLTDKEGNSVWPVEKEYFEIKYFNKALSQQGIEEYNKQISNANFLINLYNQA